jgi:glycosyltransferase involved in cell wall biosynthesis
MRIGFDISQTGSCKAGCGYFADGLIRQLSVDDRSNEYVLYPAVGDFFWDPEAATRTFMADRPGFHRWTAPATAEGSRHFWCNPGDDFERRIADPDIFHANNFFCPWGLKRARLVYTLYDLSFLEDPAWTSEQNRIGCFSGVFRASTHADWVVAISEYSRRHFLDIFPHFAPARISVVYPASRFASVTADGRTGRFTHLRPDGFWLSVGTIEPRKNHSRLLDAYRILKGKGAPLMPLVLVGGKGWLMEHFNELMTGLEPGRDVILPGYVSDSELHWLFSNCFGFVYPSLFEGFGMPVLEALACGAPVLCSNSSSLPEAAGNSALLFDPLDTKGIVVAMESLLRGETSRDTLRSSGFEQAKRFSWAASAARVREIYDHIMTLPPRVGSPVQPLQSGKPSGSDGYTN